VCGEIQVSHEICQNHMAPREPNEEEKKDETTKYTNSEKHHRAYSTAEAAK